MISFDEIRKNEAINTYIKCADESLKTLGYTEHSFAHVLKVASVAKYILETLGYSKKDAELAQIAAYLHDIGNLVNRVEHSQSSAVMAFRILESLDMKTCDVATVVTAIGNHDEGTGIAVNPVAAALILGDKTDVRRSRVRNTDISKFDIHDRVNYSVMQSEVEVLKEKSQIRLTLEIDTRYGSIMDYFEIFMQRMIMCRKAAETIGLQFKLVINGQTLI